MSVVVVRDLDLGRGLFVELVWSHVDVVSLFFFAEDAHFARVFLPTVMLLHGFLKLSNLHHKRIFWTMRRLDMLE